LEDAEFKQVINEISKGIEAQIKQQNLKSFNAYASRFGWNFTEEQYDSYIEASMQNEYGEEEQ
jgi:hypothetical protein